MDESLLQDVVTAAKAAGADAAEAVFAQRQSLSITVRLGELEEVEREESRDLGVRVFVGKSQAAVSGSDISAEGRRKLVERVVAMARLAPEDPEILNNLAVACEATGETARTLAAYKKALELRPDDSRIKRNYARFAEYYTSLQRASGPTTTPM